MDSRAGVFGNKVLTRRRREQLSCYNDCLRECLAVGSRGRVSGGVDRANIDGERSFQFFLAATPYPDPAQHVK